MSSIVAWEDDVVSVLVFCTTSLLSSCKLHHSIGGIVCKYSTCVFILCYVVLKIALELLPELVQ